MRDRTFSVARPQRSAIITGEDCLRWEAERFETGPSTAATSSEMASSDRGGMGDYTRFRSQESVVTKKSGRLIGNYPQSTVEQAQLMGLDRGHFDTLGGVKNVADIYPLTPTQNGILYHALHDPDPELYFEQVRCDLIGTLDIERLEAAWSTVFQRHPALRTAFVWSGVKQPVQVVREHVDLAFTTVEMTEDEMTNDVGFLDDLAATNRADGFDLQRAPVSRFTVVVLGPERAHFIWDFHHILLDGWSATSVFDEALHVYNDPSSVAAAAGVPFRRYLEWLQTQDVEAAEQHWSGLMADHPGAPEFRLAAPAPATATAIGKPDRTVARREHYLSADTVDLLRQFAGANQVTLNTVVQGAWAVVLGRHCDQSDVTFGVVTSGRPAELDGVEDIIGMFLAALPLRVDLDHPADVTSWLRAIQGQQLDLISYQYTALADVRRLAGLAAGEELFDSVLVFENFPVAAPTSEQPALAVADKHVFEQTHYGLTIMIRPGAELGLSTLFDPAKFSANDVDRLIELFLVTLTELASSPHQRPAELVPLLEADRQFLEASMRTEQFFESEATLHQLIERTCQTTPAVVAVIEHGSGTQLTFQELDDRSRKLASALRAAGVGSGDAVGVSMPRSAEQVIALLGIWRAGAAYVPIDPEHPEGRRNLMVERARTRLVIDPGEFARLCNSDAAPLSVVVEATAVACVIFTSGSTGEPKPVELHHRGIVNRCQWQLELHPMTDDEVCVAKTTLNFVDHLWELWGPLLAGRPIVLLDDETVKDPKRFAAALAQHGVRRLTLVPSLLDVVVDALVEAEVPLELITVSGETTPGQLAARVAEQIPGVRLFNFYGMSEGTADATWCEVGPETDSTRPLPIGRPLANMSVLVLDRQQRPVPLGVSGELFVGGVGVATGYRGQRELTNEHFIDLYGERFYRTGDIGRWNDGDQLEFLGRRDRQVKVRGVRVEPAEVEAELKQHPTITDVVVSVIGEAGRTQLIAHVVSTEQAAPDAPASGMTAEILQWAREILPAALVPSRVVLIDALPMLATGKIDRTALEQLAAEPRPFDSPASARPLTELEQRMTELWQDVLAIDRPIGPDEDFFDIGGDSLLAVRLFSQIDREYSRELPLAEVFEAATPRAMIARLGLEPDHEAGTDLPILWLISDQPERFAKLQRRLGRSVIVATGSADDVFDKVCGAGAALDADAESERPIHLAAHGTEATAALDVCRRLCAAGRTVESLLLIDAAVTQSDLVLSPEARPQALYFFEPSETETRVPLLDSPELKARLDDRIRWSDAAVVVDTVLAPGTPKDLLAEPNVSWLANLIADRIDSSSTWHHLVPIGENENPHQRLFAVHGEFGNVIGYRDLAVALGPTWSVVGVQASGVFGTRPLHRSIEEMAEAYLEEVYRLQPEGPYLIGGYSSGGTVAYEMARRLTAAGHEVEPVLWFDHYRVEALITETKSRQLARLAGNRLKAALTDRDAFQAGLKRRELQRKVDTIMAGDPTEREWWWSITELADDRAEAENIRRMLIGDNMRDVRSRYRHDSYDGPIVLYQAHTVDIGREPDRGWSDEAFDLERVAVPGDHTSLLLEPNVAAIAADLHARFGEG